jgi:hypothetical protein
LSDEKKRRLYDRYGKEGAEQAEQAEEAGHSHAGHSPFGGGGMHFGGGHQPHHGGMSQQEADLLFSHFFGGSDPFGGGLGGRRQQPQRGQMDPFATMFGGGGMPMGGMPGGMPSRGGMRRRPEKRYDAIPAATIVSFKGLKSQPERNGDRGEVAEYDAAAGRYIVFLEDSDEYLRVKPENLLQHVHLRLHGIESQPTFNGQRGTIIAWSDQKERYNIHVMDLGKMVSLKPGNVVLDNDTVAMIFGLQSKPELNGRYGTIKAFHRDTGRYDVQLSADQLLRLKLENVRV